ncbi:hypothetical protein QBC45DRAFT_354702, partial [Copromyces sp. CBS 386.78]
MRSTCPPPPAVHSYVDLVNFKETHKDTIFVAADVENIDHAPRDPQRPPYTPMEKLSEMGVAVFDPKSSSSSSSEMEQIQAIDAQHTLIDKWAWVNSKTCPNRNKPWHVGVHKASPYTATFCPSKVQSRQKVMSELTKFLQALQTQNLTAKEIAGGVRRKVVVLSWDSNAESKLFDDYAYDFLGSNKIEHWDFQLWEPILKRFGRKNKTGAEKFYKSTGVLGSGDNSITLHNASNDAWAQLATLLRFFHMSEECFSRWVCAGEDLKPLDMSWVDLEILHYNSGLERTCERNRNRHVPPGRATMEQECNQHLNPILPPALNDTAVFPSLPAPTIAPVKAANPNRSWSKNPRGGSQSIASQSTRPPETSSSTSSSASSSPSASPLTNSSTPPSTVPSPTSSPSTTPPTLGMNALATGASTILVGRRGADRAVNQHRGTSTGTSSTRAQNGSGGTIGQEYLAISFALKFKPFRSTFEKAKTGAGAAFASLWVCGESTDDATVLHNAANDTFSQLVAFLRFMVMTKKEWRIWHGACGGCLDPVDLSWIGDEILKRNQELRPRLKPGETPQEVEDLDPEDHEPVVVHQSAMAEINAGYTSTTVGSAPEPNS